MPGHRQQGGHLGQQPTGQQQLCGSCAKRTLAEEPDLRCLRSKKTPNAPGGRRQTGRLEGQGTCRRWPRLQSQSVRKPSARTRGGGQAGCATRGRCGVSRRMRTRRTTYSTSRRRPSRGRCCAPGGSWTAAQCAVGGLAAAPKSRPCSSYASCRRNVAYV